VLLVSARRDRFEAPYVLALHCGLRLGELLGLKCDDVDLEARTLKIRRTLSEAHSGNLFESPKGGKGRNVGLTEAAIEALRGHLDRQLTEIEARGDGYQDNELVFPSKLGTPWAQIT
jgi:integrase